MAETKIYKKVGRRYVEIGESDRDGSYYPHGAHLVVAQLRSKLIKYDVKPEYAAVEAALQVARDGMFNAIVEATKMRPATRLYSQKELAGIAAMRAIVGDMPCIVYESLSIYDVIEAGIKEVQKQMRENCRKCDGKMLPGKALRETLAGMADFHGGEVVTVSPGGPGKLVDCLKCTQCGWSVT